MSGFVVGVRLRNRQEVPLVLQSATLAKGFVVRTKHFRDPGSWH